MFQVGDRVHVTIDIKGETGCYGRVVLLHDRPQDKIGKQSLIVELENGLKLQYYEDSIEPVDFDSELEFQRRIVYWNQKLGEPSGK